ncbi:MAG: radical SAM protein [Campylobacterota bacterium]|nr:radical SAM protein [Campylobacterota bacterium]
MLHYSYPIYRPPAEADNIILQITHGCSHNNCTFCTMYKVKSYTVRDQEDIFADIDILAKHYPDTIKVFLADGDPLGVDTDYMIEILKYLKFSFKKLRRVSTYATTSNILSKSPDELKRLYDNNLNLLYLGIETGDDEILNNVNKGVEKNDIIKSIKLVNDANIKISATVILGLGGKNYTKQHIENTAYIINSTKINYLSTLQLGLEDNIKKRFYNKFEDFEPLDDEAILKEQKELISKIEPLNKIIFRSNHASNALHLAGTLPKDKERLIGEIDNALENIEQYTIPKIFRGF